jgi:ParB family transcriptional regulator, chromosome partitioning protein
LIEKHGDESPDDILAEIEDISTKIDALSEGAERWLPEDIAIAGAVIGIGHDGKLSVERGLVRPEDEPADEATAPNSSPKTGRASNDSGLSDRLTEGLTAHRTAALRALLADNTEVALTAVVYALALPVFFPYQQESCLELSLSHMSLHGSAEGIDETPAGETLAKQHVLWQERLPQSPDDLWGWLLDQDTTMRLGLLAYCAACSVNAVKKRHERADSDHLVHAERLAVALHLDMTQWWQPTAASYLRHVPKARILEAVREGATPEAAENLAKMKKEALAAEAEQRLAGTGWLPALLRSPATAPIETNTSPAAT